MTSTVLHSTGQIAGDRSEGVAVVELLIPLHGIGGRGDLPVPLWHPMLAAMVAFTAGGIALVTAS